MPIPSFGYELAKFTIDADHERASSFCVYTDEAGSGSMLNDDCGDNNDVNVGVDAGDLVDLDSGCNTVRIVEVDPTSVSAPPDGSVAMMCDIKLPAGVEIADDRTVTVTLAFKLTDGSTRSNYDNGSKVFEVLYLDENTKQWKSDGITFNYDTDVRWNSDNASGIVTVETSHFTVFAVSSKQGSNNRVGDDDDDDSQALGGSGCSVVPTVNNMSTGSAFANTLIFLIPLIIIGIRKKRNAVNWKEK